MRGWASEKQIHVTFTTGTQAVLAARPQAFRPWWTSSLAKRPGMEAPASMQEPAVAPPTTTTKAGTTTPSAIRQGDTPSAASALASPRRTQTAAPKTKPMGVPTDIPTSRAAESSARAKGRLTRQGTSGANSHGRIRTDPASAPAAEVHDAATNPKTAQRRARLPTGPRIGEAVDGHQILLRHGERPYQSRPATEKGHAQCASRFHTRRSRRMLTSTMSGSECIEVGRRPRR